MFVRKGEVGNISQIALTTFLPGQVADAHKHPDMFEIFMIQSEKGEMTVGGERMEVGAGDCVVVSPGQMHEVKNSGEEMMRILVIGEEVGERG